MPLKQRLTNSSIAKAVFLLTLVVVASWLGRLLSLGSGVHSVAGHEGSHPAAQACEKKISTPGADAETEQTLPKVVSKTLAARLSTAVLMSRSSQQQKLGGPPGGLPLELARGHVVEKRDSAPDGKGRSRRATIFRTDFKYPLLRLEQEIVNDPSGGEIVTAQLVMVADHLLVKLQEGFTETELSIHIASMGAKILRHLPNSPFYTVVLNRATVAEFDKALSALEVAPGPLAYAEPDFISIGGSAPVYPNDPSFALQWDLHNTGQNGGTPGADIHAPEAWSVSTGSASVIVAVIDTGMDLTHPDLVANLWTNPNETGGGNDSDGLDNDHNGYIDDEHGWNFYDKNANPLDDNGHGSHTSGTVGAVGNNGKGISGVNQTVRIMPLKFLNANGSGTNSDAIEAINYATANQAFVTSNSWGGSGYSQGMFDAISTANAAGVGFIAAAGNSGISNDKYPDYPASFNVDNIISVAATDNTDTLAWFSNFGQATVHLAAPGVNTYSTYKNGGYTAMSGTSMATPHVSGAAALLKAANTALSFAKIKAMLVSQCDPQPSLAGKVASGGRLNVARSLVPATGPLLQANVLTVDDNPVNGATGNADHIASPGETVKIIIQVANIGAFDATNVQGALTVKNNDTGITLAQANTSYGTITAGTSVNNAAPAFVISIAANKTPSDVILTLVLSDSSGNSWTQDLTLKVRTVATLSGVVTALTGGAPLAGATILITGPENHTITTQADGSYSVVLTNGGYSVRASATGFIAETKTINVPPSVTNLDFILGYSQAQITPLTLSSTQNEGETKSQTITIANNGDKAMTYKIVQVPPKLPGNTGALSINPPPVSRNLSPSDMEISPPHKLSFSRLADASTSSQSPLPFADGFEDGMWGRWFPSLADSSVREVVGNTAGTGAKSFHFHYAGPEDAHLTGIEQDFDWGSKPGYVNFWTRPGPEDQATAYTVLGDVSFVLDDTGFHIYLVDFIWFFANANGRFYLNDNVGGNQSVVYTENQWYHIEFRNIDWQTKTFDYWVDDQLIQAGVPFRNPASANEMIVSLHYNYSSGTDAWWDDFKFFPSELPWIGLSGKEGTIAPGTSAEITVTFDSVNELAGVYTGTLLVQTNDPVAPDTEIPVSMTVNKVPNDPPHAVSQSLTMGMNTTQAITLHGSDADNGLQQLVCKIIALPSRGKLYQTSDGVTLDRQISNTPTVVSHPQWKVLFQPVTGEVGAPYSSFSYVVHDPKIDSAPALVSINVGPVLAVLPPGATSFNPVTATFAANDANAIIRFTSDGSTPSANSFPIANGSTFRMDHSMALNATAFLNGIPGPPVSLSFNITDANLNGIPDWWEAQYFDLSTAVAPDPNADTDGNGLSNMQEFIFGTNPRGVSHVVPTLQNPSQPVVSWASISGRYYSLESSPDLIHWQQVTSLQPGTGGTMSFTEPQAVTGANFYRIRVTLP